jgi:thiol:disulfide interchange protein DsbD
VVTTGARFGVINSSPLFNAIIAVIFILMALAMFDIIHVDFTRFRKAGGVSGERGKIIAVFFMGIIASLLAGACVAPVVISVVLYAGSLYAGGNPVGLLLPFLLGIGMALPWPFAGAGLSFLPKPGKWMVWVKYVFGIFILGMALYYGYEGISLFRKQTAVKNSAPTEASRLSPADVPWHHSIEEGLEKAATEKKPVFIDFWATWCKNCAAMDASTFRDPNVKKLLANYILVKYQAEKTDEPATKRILDRFGIVGLPTYVILTPK